MRQRATTNGDLDQEEHTQTKIEDTTNVDQADDAACSDREWKLKNLYEHEQRSDIDTCSNKDTADGYGEATLLDVTIVAFQTRLFDGCSSPSTSQSYKI